MQMQDNQMRDIVFDVMKLL